MCKERRVLSWRSSILTQISDRVQDRLLLIADSDGLVTSDENMISEIRNLGYEPVVFEDSIMIRYIYESKYRLQVATSVDTQSNQPKLAILFAGSSHEAIRKIPFDIVNAAMDQGEKIISVTIPEIFPKLSYSVLDKIETKYFDKLYDSYQNYDGPQLGDKQSKEYILNKVFEISVSNMASSRKEFVRILLSLHYSRGILLPSILCDYVVKTLTRIDTFAEWPIENLLQSNEYFFNFLQIEWQEFLQSFISGAQPQPQNPTKIPFEHRDIRVFLDNLFLEGYLKPIEIDTDLKDFPGWTHSGILIDTKKYAVAYIQKLANDLELDLPDENDNSSEWQKFALDWSELLVLRFKNSKIIPNEIDERITRLHDLIEKRFAKWMSDKYFTLSSLPYFPRPIMVHHIPRFLSHRYSNGDDNSRTTSKIALIVVDGMSLDQWMMVKEAIGNAGINTEETAIFAWVPTLTNISRQSIFAAEPPFYFEATLDRTDVEEKHWQNYWQDIGFRKEQIYYSKGHILYDEKEVDELVSNIGDKKVAGIVINTVDQIMHGTILGTAEMHLRVQKWMEQGAFIRLIQRLLDEEFSIYVTADHGNIASIGQGKPRQGILVDSAGSRARIYPNEIFLNQGHDQYPTTSIIWPNSGMHDHYFLLSAARLAFADKDERLVSHGGISLEEVLVPFVHVARGKNN